MEIKENQELKLLQAEFDKHSKDMLDSLKKGADIVIKKNKDSFKFYCNLVKKM